MSTDAIAHGVGSFRRRTPTVKKTMKWLVPLIAAAALAAGVVHWARSRPATAVHWETATVDRGPVVAKVTATGTVSALVTVLVGSQVSGRIDGLYVDYGDVVKKGDRIASIEPSLFRAAVAQARANHTAAVAAAERASARAVQAESDYARAKSLEPKGIVSRAEYEAALANLQAARADVSVGAATVAQARAALDQAELNLRYTTIISPIDGVVVSRNVDVGQTVAAALQAPTLFTIAHDLTQAQVDTNVAEADIGKIRPGSKVTFGVDAYPNRMFEGVVRQVRDNATTIQNVVTYDAVLDVDNKERLLKPGMTASVTFVYATRDDVLRVPNGALRFRPEPAVLAAMNANAQAPTKAAERVVWVVRGDRAVPVVVEVGIADATNAEITSGDVHPGERVVIDATIPKQP